MKYYKVDITATVFVEAESEESAYEAAADSNKWYSGTIDDLEALAAIPDSAIECDEDGDAIEETEGASEARLG